MTRLGQRSRLLDRSFLRSSAVIAVAIAVMNVTTYGYTIIAAHTIDARIAELVDSKASLAARALDGDDTEVTGETSVQLDALVALLRDALKL